MEESYRGPEFDLLCLQEDEYYFRDYACQFSVATKPDIQLDSAASATADADDGSIAAVETGVLKLCSSSIYVVPHKISHPVVRIPLDCIATIAE
jgi:hypothetical protein